MSLTVFEECVWCVYTCSLQEPSIWAKALPPSGCRLRGYRVRQEIPPREMLHLWAHCTTTWSSGDVTAPSHDPQVMSLHYHMILRRMCTCMHAIYPQLMRSVYVELTTSLGLALVMLTTRHVLSVTLLYNIMLAYHTCLPYLWIRVLHRVW